MAEVLELADHAAKEKGRHVGEGEINDEEDDEEMAEVVARSIDGVQFGLGLGLG